MYKCVCVKREVIYGKKMEHFHYVIDCVMVSIFVVIKYYSPFFFHIYKYSIFFHNIYNFFFFVFKRNCLNVFSLIIFIQSFLYFLCFKKIPFRPSVPSLLDLMYFFSRSLGPYVLGRIILSWGITPPCHSFLFLFNSYVWTGLYLYPIF